MATIQGIYIALFGRPADPLGLDYFNSITDGGQDLSEIDSLAGQPEYLSRFEGMNSAQIVTSIYQELFGRNPDAAGLAFFVAALNSGEQNINTIAINIYDGAQNEDLAILEAKEAAANQFTDAVRADNDALAAYQGQDGIDFGNAFLDQIDSGDDVLTDEQVQAQVEAFGNGEAVPGLPTPNDPATTFTLTTGEDFADQAGSVRNDGDIPSNFRFTVGNETVIASGATLGATDTLSDSSTTDNDILNLALSGATVPGAATISNIETINVDFSSYTGGALNLGNVSGAKVLDLDGTLGAQANIAGLATSGITTVDGSGLTSITNGFTASFDGAIGTTARTITGSGAADGLQGADGADVINGGGGNDVILGGAGADALNGNEGDDNISGESGNDTVDGGAGVDTIDGGLGNDIILGGAGNDILTGGAGDNSITGGAGNDTITLSGAHDTVVFDATSNGADVIIGFEQGGAGVAGGGDTLDFSAFLGADASFVLVPANSVGAAGNPGFTATDSNVVILAADGDVDTAGELQAAIGSDATDLHLAVSSNTVVLLEIADIDPVAAGAQVGVQAYYVTTNELGEATDVTLVGTINGATAAGFVDYNFG